MPDHQLRQRVRQHHLEERARARGAEAARRPHEHLLAAARAVIGRQRHRQHAADEDEHDLRPVAESEPQHRHRDERRFRHRIEHLHDRVEQHVQGPVPRHQHADDGADRDRHAEPGAEPPQRIEPVPDEVAAHQQVEPRDDDGAQARQGELRDEARTRRPFPDRRENEERQIAKEGVDDCTALDRDLVERLGPGFGYGGHVSLLRFAPSSRAFASLTRERSTYPGLKLDPLFEDAEPHRIVDLLLRGLEVGNAVGIAVEIVMREEILELVGLLLRHLGRDRDRIGVVLRIEEPAQRASSDPRRNRRAPRGAAR